MTNGRLGGSTELAKVFGTCERIYFGEFDSPRKRTLVSVVGE